MEPELVFPAWVLTHAQGPNSSTDRIKAALMDAAADAVHEVCINLPNGMRVPAGLIRWLLLEAPTVLGRHIPQLVIQGAVIEGCLHLEGTNLGLTPCFAGCRFVAAADGRSAGINLTDATIVGLEVIGGELACLHADRLTAAGSVLIRGRVEDVTYRHKLPPNLGATIKIPHGILLSGAKIRGNLDLRGAKLEPLPEFQDGSVVALLADGVTIEGSALLCAGFEATGEVRLNGAHIHRNLDCSGAKLRNSGGYSLSAADATVDGCVYFRRDQRVQPAGQTAGQAESVGTLRLDGAHIKGELDATGCFVTSTAFDQEDWKAVPDKARDLIALRGAALDVGGVVRFRDGFTARGAVNLISAKIGTDLDCSDAVFDFPGEEAFYADGATISGGAYFDRSRSTGLIRFEKAEMRQGCFFSGFVIDLRDKRRGWAARFAAIVDDGSGDAKPVDEPDGIRDDIAGLYAANAVVGGTFIWTGVTAKTDDTTQIDRNHRPQRVAWLCAPGASVTDVTDDNPSWQAVRQINLRDCVYQRISQETVDFNWRLARLDEQYAPWNTERGWGSIRLAWEVLCRTHGRRRRTDSELNQQVLRFAPGPYLQLAKVLREAGLESASEDVLLRLERNRALYSGLSQFGILGRWVLDLTLQYGQAPFRLLRYVAIWAVISWVAFDWMPLANAPHSGPPFDPLYYTLDTLIPFVDFGQKKNFVIPPLPCIQGFLVLINTFAGYAVASFLAAGLSGLVRTGKGD